ncbi:tyrosine-type recombinase/integrase [Streptomyces sp. NPDC088745]|uniref:tyrosine-type recombinase/integrase n=1 Tax=Streptomyces sp. NPDC088745 TaxID=3365884 RepID=UPI00381AADF9
MVTKTLTHGMGTFFKECAHAKSRWPKCPHPYKIQFRDITERQRVESGFQTETAAVGRLLEVYNAKRAARGRGGRAERVAKYGAMRFGEYAAEWRGGQRHLEVGSLVRLDSLMKHHILPVLGSRRMDSFDHEVVDGFIRAMERAGAGLATQANAFDKLRAVLLYAHRLGLYDTSPLEGVKPPQYDPARAVIPSTAQLAGIRVAGDDMFRLVADLMSGSGLRNGEALAVNVRNIVADDVHRITEQVNHTTHAYARLKHRKVNEYRDVPLPARTRETVEWYADKYGTVDGCLLRHPNDPGRPLPYYYLGNQWAHIKKAGEAEIPDGMVLYGMRHFFASNCLSHNIPITDVAEWMGHRSIDITYKIYRHLMPGSINTAAKILNIDLAA